MHHGSLFVALDHPFAHDLTYFVEIAEQIQVQHLIAQAAVETFDIGVPIRLARLDVVNEDPADLVPSNECVAHKYRAAAHAQHVRIPTLRRQPLKDTCQAFGTQQGIDHDSEHFPIEVLDDAEGAEARAVIQRIARKSADQTWLVRCGISSGSGYRCGRLHGTA